jgi:ubiquinone/menaquinone biosynthesis C-methylase UbiE
MSSSSAYHQLFDTQAEAYSNFRPGYSQELYDVIYEYAGLQVKGELAVDIATGSGQAAQVLASKFERVVGLDANDQQLSCAKGHPNIEYAVGDAHATGLPDSCADLVTVAQALHW